jgi:ribosome maturation factor RimP
MIDKQLLTETVQQAIADTDIFLVDVRVSPSNEIVVEIDSPEGIDIDTCVGITRKVEAVFDRDVEDYELEVGSAGLTAPFKVRGQYLKNIGNEIEILTRDGRKFSGTLTAVADDDSFTVAVPTKVFHPGAKRPVIEDVEQTLSPADCKSVKYVINFK